MPLIINEMVANIRPDPDTVITDSNQPTATGSDEAAQKLRRQLAIEEERKERLQID